MVGNTMNDFALQKGLASFLGGYHTAQKDARAKALAEGRREDAVLIGQSIEVSKRWLEMVVRNHTEGVTDEVWSILLEAMVNGETFTGTDVWLLFKDRPLPPDRVNVFMAVHKLMLGLKETFGYRVVIDEDDLQHYYTPKRTQV